MSCQGCGKLVSADYLVLACGKKCKSKAGLQALVNGLGKRLSTHCLVEQDGMLTLRSKEWAENPQISPDVARFLSQLKTGEFGFLVDRRDGYMMSTLTVTERRPNPFFSTFYNADLSM